MTTQLINKRIDDIKAAAPDCEAAHSMEDKLREDFIAYVGRVASDSLRAKAALVLSTKAIEFPRHTA